MDNIWRNTYGSGYRCMPRPVVVRAFDYQDGYREIWHSHEQAQLVYATSGVVRILTPAGSWLLPPSRAMWIVPGVDHELHAVGAVALRSVYFEPDAVSWLSADCSMIEVSGLLHELIVGMLADPLEYTPDSRAALIAPLLLRALRDAPAAHGGLLPLPTDARLRQICEKLMHDPGNDNTLEVWGEQFGLSTRTLARHFRDETGLSFGQWRQQMRVSEAVYRLILKQPLADVAGTLGYASQSAFITMFRKSMGTTPQRYLASLG